MSERQPDKEKLIRKGRRLAYLTVAWNALEGAAAIISGSMAGSVALIAFGADSAIETLSGVVMIWRFSASNEADRDRTEAISLRLIGWILLALAAYVSFDSFSSIIHHEAPTISTAGIVVSLLALVVMPLLARQKRSVATQIQSDALSTDARQTDFCFYLSLITLIGLALNALLGWWWADPAAALLMVPIIAKEGIDAAKGKSCCGSCHE